MDSESEKVCAENLSERKLEGLCEPSDLAHPSISCTQGDVCNTSDVVRANMRSELGGPMLLSPVHKAT